MWNLLLIIKSYVFGSIDKNTKFIVDLILTVSRWTSLSSFLSSQSSNSYKDHPLGLLCPHLDPIEHFYLLFIILIIKKLQVSSINNFNFVFKVINHPNQDMFGIRQLFRLLIIISSFSFFFSDVQFHFNLSYVQLNFVYNNFQIQNNKIIESIIFERLTLIPSL